MNEVATPKLPPPPRSAQNRSGCEEASTSSTSPAAVTSSTPSRLSDARPYFAISQPSPPPSVRPAMPVVETAPPVTARPCAPAASLSSAQVTPPCAVAVRPGGIDGDVLHVGEADHHPAVGDGAAGDVVAAAAHRHLEARAARERERGDDVLGRPGADDQRRPAVDEAVVDGAGLVVARLVRDEDGTRDPPGEFTDDRVVHRDAHFCSAPFSRGVWMPQRASQSCASPGARFRRWIKAALAERCAPVADAGAP